MLCHFRRKRRIPRLYGNTVVGFHSLSKWTYHFFCLLAIISYAGLIFNMYFLFINRICMRFSHIQCAIIRFELLKTSYRGFLFCFPYTKAIVAATSISYQNQTFLISIQLVSDYIQAFLTYIPVYNSDYQ